jgi:hypothetical protein
MRTQTTLRSVLVQIELDDQPAKRDEITRQKVIHSVARGRPA